MEERHLRRSADERAALAQVIKMADRPHCFVTATVLTKNEASLIGRCLDSLRWVDEILVLDSGSSDATREIAAQRGASVHVQSWLGWVDQHRASVDLAKNDWILVVDADEIITPELANSILGAMRSSPDAKDGYVVERRDELFGKLMPNMRRRSKQNTFVRLFNRKRSNFRKDDLIHEGITCPGQYLPLDGTLLHWRNVTFTAQMFKDLENAELEAEQMARRGKRVGALQLILKPMARFGWCYVVKGAFLHGSVGLVYSLMIAHAEFLRNTRLWERQHTRPARDPPEDVWNPEMMPKPTGTK